MLPQAIPPWSGRKNKVFWRGSTTGGGNNPAGRQLAYQRHRFVRFTSENSSDPLPIVLPAQEGASEISFLEMPADQVNDQIMDVAFTSMDGCGHEKVCDAVKYGMYKMGKKVPLLDITKYKMLVDIDGMAYSARFMALLESGAAVLKSTIYSEYYSDQIQRTSEFLPTKRNIGLIERRVTQLGTTSSQSRLCTARSTTSTASSSARRLLRKPRIPNRATIRILRPCPPSSVWTSSQRRTIWAQTKLSFKL